MELQRCAWCDANTPSPIGAAADHLGVSVAALRYYEAQGLVEPMRDGAGHRLFPLRAMDALHVVVTMRDAGFGITEVRRLIRQKADLPPSELVARARGVLAAQLQAISRRRAELDRAEALMRRWCQDLDSTGW